jgi:RimJ/RimL family protein N-acetyltransferase
MKGLLHTARLDLRPCQVSDLNSVYQLWTDADVRRFLFDDREISYEEARSLIETSAANFSNYGYGLWLFFERNLLLERNPLLEHNSDQPAGFAGLLHSVEELPGLIFGTRPQLWRRGYAREAALAVLGYAFDVLGLEGVVADVDAPNVASIRVLEALGLSQCRSAIVNQRPLLYYELQAHRWHTRA